MKWLSTSLVTLGLPSYSWASTWIFKFSWDYSTSTWLFTFYKWLLDIKFTLHFSYYWKLHNHIHKWCGKVHRYIWLCDDTWTSHDLALMTWNFIMICQGQEFLSLLWLWIIHDGSLFILHRHPLNGLGECRSLPRHSVMVQDVFMSSWWFFFVLLL